MPSLIGTDYKVCKKNSQNVIKINVVVAPNKTIWNRQENLTSEIAPIYVAMSYALYRVKQYVRSLS